MNYLTHFEKQCSFEYDLCVCVLICLLPIWLEKTTQNTRKTWWNYLDEILRIIFQPRNLLKHHNIDRLEPITASEPFISRLLPQNVFSTSDRIRAAHYLLSETLLAEFTYPFLLYSLFSHHFCQYFKKKFALVPFLHFQKFFYFPLGWKIMQKLVHQD